MSAIETPAPEAPAEEWGALAESIPGWADLPGDRSGPHRMPRLGPRSVPDPDHWAWEGWMLSLLGPGEWDNVAPGCAIAPRGEGWWAWMNGDWSEGMTLGRACIAAAATKGRWPGGGG